MKLSYQLLIFNGICIVLMIFPVPLLLLPILIPVMALGNIIICGIYAYNYYKSSGGWRGMFENLFLNSIGIDTPPYKDGTWLDAGDCANAATLCQAKDKYFDGLNCYCGKSTINCDDEKAGTCTGKTAVDNNVCQQLTTNCGCLQQVTGTGVQQCVWIDSGKTYSTGTCIGNTAVDNAECSPITKYSECEGHKNFAQVKNCTWVSSEDNNQSGTCKPNTSFDNICTTFTKYSDCVGQKNGAGVRQCYWQ